MLTKKQSDLLRYLYARQEEGAFISPSYDEMRDAMGLKSKCGIHRLVVCLEERGFIERLPQRPRSIRVLAGPGEAPRRPVTPQDLKELVSPLGRAGRAGSRHRRPVRVCRAGRRLVHLCRRTCLSGQPDPSNHQRTARRFLRADDRRAGVPRRRRRR